VDSGPSYLTNPPTYACVDACALLFGGTSGQYSCSTTNDPTTINHLASVDGWGDNSHCGGNYVADTYKLNTNYNCGSSDCAFSAYVMDHSCAAINYCFH
jgi:hypothetical protein